MKQGKLTLKEEKMLITRIEELSSEGEAMEFSNGELSPAGKTFGEIYKIAHVLLCECRHPDWEKELLLSDN